MKGGNLIRYFALAAIVSAALLGCAKSEPEPVGMANPAAVYCEKHGVYDLETGMCTLKSGEKVDAWEYFRAHHQQDPDSAARFCEAMGGGYIEDKKQCAFQMAKLWMQKSTFVTIK
ncbi:hypothetical protein JCM19240_1122 [Vibrio maritimus]|uniref:Lipoprotein n=1 Tax=Vibrio maritimus TaxID=990268 RepID=A0A090T627_9VIBR|nr:hypothetical protein JCM19240_1122 [Vibrio maritimus]